MLKSIIFFAILSFVFSTATLGQINFQTGNYDEMVANAQKTQKPFFIVFGFEECAVCKKMEENTYSQANITKYVNENITPYKIDALSFDGIGTAQYFNVTQFPTLMIFDENGKKMCTIRGYNSAETLLGEFRTQIAIINRLKDSPKPIFVGGAIAVEEATKENFSSKKEEVKQKIKETEQSEVTPKFKLQGDKVEPAAPRPVAGPQGKPAVAASTYGVVAGLEAKSIMNKHPQGFGIQVTSVNSVEELNAQVAKYSKRWKQDLWVYSQTLNGSTSYYLLFGTFEDQDAADEMNQMMADAFGINGSIINLNSIK